MVEPFTLATARRTLELPNRQNLKFVGVEQHFEGVINVWCRQPGDGDVFGLKRRSRDGATFLSAPRHLYPSRLLPQGWIDRATVSFKADITSSCLSHLANP